MKYAMIDIETTGLDRNLGDKINYIGIGLAKDINSSLTKKYIFNVRKKSHRIKFMEVVKKLKRLKIKCVYQNGKFDTLFIKEEFDVLLPIHDDVMLLGTAYKMDDSHALKYMCAKYLGSSDWDIPLKEKKKPNNPIVEKYLESDLDEPWELYKFFRIKLSKKQKKVYKHLLLPAYLMYRKAEINGIYLDLEGLEKVKKKYQKELDKADKTMKDYANINWNSPQQVSKVLFEQYKLPVIKLTSSGNPSSDAKVLKRLASEGHQIAIDLQNRKFYYGATSKFLNQWGKYAEKDGRIHPNFGLTNVRTGRTSCSNPNLQQVPRNKELRNLYTAPPGRVLIEADYSQLELRIAAHYSGDRAMLKIYKDGGDIHTETGCSLAGCKPDKLTYEQRSKAKPVNFGFLFGMFPKGFVDYAFDNYDTVFTLEEAKHYRGLFFSKYASLPQWHENMKYECEVLGGVENMFGQFRDLPDIYSSNWSKRGSAERKAINTPVQGTGSGLLLVSAVEIQKKLSKRYDALVCGTIHDAVLVECPEEHADIVSQRIKEIMESPEALKTFNINLKTPLVADVEVGCWGGH